MFASMYIYVRLRMATCIHLSILLDISDNSRSTGRGYQRLCQKDADTDRKSETEHSTEDSEDSNLEDGSDSEFEWSGENDSEFITSDEEASEEKESLL
uniref:Uncharacterized protein n=1 Tax=Octopus bimaculoides TaxID=37653 RepID=A0A0L8HLG0_OCTBM